MEWRDWIEALFNIREHKASLLIYIQNRGRHLSQCSIKNWGKRETRRNKKQIFVNIVIKTVGAIN